MTEDLYSETAFNDFVYNDKQLSISYNLLRHVFLMNITDRGTHKFLGEEFNQWDKNTFNQLIDKLRKLYQKKYTANINKKLRNSCYYTKHYDYETNPKKIRNF